MAYADYEYYKRTYLGRAVQEEDFPRLALRASEYLDKVTFGRARDHAGEEPVRLACCAVAEELFRQEEFGGREVASESNAGRSVSFAGDERSGARRLCSAARSYLGNTGLLYRGVG